MIVPEIARGGPRDTMNDQSFKYDSPVEAWLLQRRDPASGGSNAGKGVVECKNDDGVRLVGGEHADSMPQEAMIVVSCEEFDRVAKKAKTLRKEFNDTDSTEQENVHDQDDQLRYQHSLARRRKTLIDRLTDLEIRPNWDCTDHMCAAARQPLPKQQHGSTQEKPALRGGIFVSTNWGSGGRVYRISSDCREIQVADGSNWTNVRVMQPTFNGGMWVYSNWLMGGGVSKFDRDCRLVGSSPQVGISCTYYCHSKPPSRAVCSR